MTLIAGAKTIEVEPGGGLDRLLEEAAGKPLILVKNGARYRLQPESEPRVVDETDIWANYDPERLLRAFEVARGIFKDIDTEAFIAEIYEQRGQDSHGRPSDSPMAYLLDSDWLILRLADCPPALRLVRQRAPAGLAVSVITYMEVFQGLDRDPDPVAAEVRLGHLLAAMTVLPVSREVARRCALLRRTLRQQGRRIGPRALDHLTAATAIEHDPTLVTRNVDDYRDVPGLRLHPPIDLARSNRGES